MKYRMYVDEVGNPDLASSANPNHRFLSLTGVIIDLEYVRSVLHPEMEKLKHYFFDSHPDEPIIFHRKEILNGRFPFERLKNKEYRQKFDKRLLELIKSWQFAVISICIDKKHHKDTYTTWRHDPYHYCMKLLLERFIFLLEQSQTQGDVMAESRGGKEDKRLKKAFLNLWNNGTDYVGPDRFKKVLTSKQLKVKPKASNISGLQLADLIAHPSRNEILVENGIQKIKIAPFATQIIEILAEKYYCHSKKVYGKKFI